MRDRPAIYGQPGFGSAFSAPFGSPFSNKGGVFPKGSGDLRLDLNSFEGITTVSTKVSAWADQSGHGNNVAQTLDGDRPVFNATGLNGFPSLTWAGGTQILDGAESESLSFTGSFTMYVVCKVTDLSGYRTLYDKRDNQIRFIFNITDGKGHGILNNALTLISPTGTLVNTVGIMELHWEIGSGGTVSFTQNGTSLGTAVNTQTSIAQQEKGFGIGRSDAFGQPFVGEFGRILLYANLLSTARRNSVIAALGEQYGISVTPIT